MKLSGCLLCVVVVIGDVVKFDSGVIGVLVELCVRVVVLFGVFVLVFLWLNSVL